MKKVELNYARKRNRRCTKGYEHSIYTYQVDANAHQGWRQPGLLQPSNNTQDHESKQHSTTAQSGKEV
jgi:hypothetical protein